MKKKWYQTCRPMSSEVLKAEQDKIGGGRMMNRIQMEVEQLKYDENSHEYHVLEARIANDAQIEARIVDAVRKIQELWEVHTCNVGEGNRLLNITVGERGYINICALTKDGGKLFTYVEPPHTKRRRR